MSKVLSEPLETPQQREQFIIKVTQLLMTGEISRGAVIRYLRKTLLQMNQAEFAKYSKVSRRTLTDIENNASGLNEESINRVFSIFGLTLGLVPISKAQATKIFNRGNDNS